MNTNQSATIASIEKFLKIKRINRFLASGRATLTCVHGDITFPISFIDETGHAFGEVANCGYRVEMSSDQLNVLHTFVVEHEEKQP